MTVAELLLSQRRWGATRCRKFLESVEISELKLIGDLTDRQRRVLAAALEAGQPSPAVSSPEAETAQTARHARELTYV